MDILRQYVRRIIVEAVITGRKLDRYTTAIKRHVLNAIKDPEVRDYFAENGFAQFGLQDVTEMEDLDYLRDVIVSMEDGPTISVSAAYEFDLDATPEQRRDSDLRIQLVLPRDFPDQALSYINDELVDAIRHELEHSSQNIEELMDCLGDRVNATDIWSSLASAAEYYLCPGEVKAHVAGFMKRAKSSKQPLAAVIDDELYAIYSTGILSGYEEEELGELMTMMRQAFHEYAQSRYPAARGYEEMR